MSVTDDEAPAITGPANLDYEENDTSLTTGSVLTFTTPPDYEHQNQLLVTLRSSDGSLTGTLDVVATVTNVNAATVVSGDARPNHAENGIGQVATNSALDPEHSPVTDTEENAHAAVGITVGYAIEPLQHCPNQEVTQAQMATSLHRTQNYQPDNHPTTGVSGNTGAVQGLNCDW